MIRVVSAFTAGLAFVALIAAIVFAYVGAFTDDGHAWAACFVSLTVCFVLGVFAGCASGVLT